MITFLFLTIFFFKSVLYFLKKSLYILQIIYYFNYRVGRYNGAYRNSSWHFDCLLSDSDPIRFFIQQSILYDHIHCFNAVFDLSSGSKIRACKCNEDIHSSWSLDHNHKSLIHLRGSSQDISLGKLFHNIGSSCLWIPDGWNIFNSSSSTVKLQQDCVLSGNALHPIKKASGNFHGSCHGVEVHSSFKFPRCRD